jgi:hypothetical protein
MKPDQSDLNVPDLQVTLIHGTWGRGFFPDRFRTKRSIARWFEAHSAFAAELAKNLSDQGVSCHIRAFLWSGANSISARDLAARRLTTLIEQDSVEQQQLVIGHSHGGNVVLRGVSGLHDLQRQRTMIVTLATPFLDVFPRPISSREEIFMLLSCFAVPVLLTLLALASLLYFFVQVVGVWSYLYGWWKWKIPIFGMELYEFVTISCTLAVACAASSKLFHFYNERVIGLATRKFQTSSSIADNVSILVLRSVDDEPHLAFAIGALGNRLVARALPISVLAVLLVILALPLAGFVDIAAKIFLQPGPFEGLFGHWLANFIVFGAPVGSSVSIILILLSGVMRSVFGRELLIGAFRQDVAFNSVPDHCGRITIFTLPSSGGLRHSIYNHVDCPTAIAAWAGSIVRTSFSPTQEG